MLRHVDPEITALEAADILWLAEHLPPSAAPVRLPPADPGEPTPLEPDEPEPIEPDFPEDTPSKEKHPAPDPAAPLDKTIYPTFQPTSEEPSQAVPATPLRSPMGRALPGALPLSRALRPLMRRQPSCADMDLDIEATVQHIAEQRLARQRGWLPQTEPAPERWLEVALVVDTAPNMVIWQQTVTELQQLLLQQGAFRDVRCWYFHTDQPGETALYAQNTTGSERAAVNANVLLDPAGRRLILVFTDCVAAAWHSGKAFEQLARWGAKAPLAILQALPHRLWGRTALGTQFAQARSHLPGMPNSRLQVDNPPIFTPDKSLFPADVWAEVMGDGEANTPPSRPTYIPIPIVTLEEGPMASWARVVAGLGGDTTPATLVMLPETPFHAVSANLPAASAAEESTYNIVLKNVASTEAAPASDPDLLADPMELVKRFQASASLPAQRLAGYLASVPLTLPIMRTVQEVMFDKPLQAHLAEVLLSGLVRKVPFPAAPRRADGMEEFGFDFVKDVRNLLRRTVRASETLRVVNRLSTYVLREQGQARNFETLVPDPTGTRTLLLNDKTLPFARIIADSLVTLGGANAAAGMALQERIKAAETVRTEVETSSNKLAPQVNTAASALSVTLHTETALAWDIIYHMAWSPDGQTLAAPTRDGRIWFWHENGSPPTSFTVSKFGVNQVVWEPNGKRFATASYDRLVRLYQWSGGQEPVYERRFFHGSEARCVAWSPDGQWLASGSAHGTLRVWNTHTWKREETYIGGQGINTICWSPDSHTLGFGCEDGLLGICSKDDLHARRIFLHYDTSVTCIVWRDKDTLICGTGAGLIDAWRLIFNNENELSEGSSGSESTPSSSQKRNENNNGLPIAQRVGNASEKHATAITSLSVSMGTFPGLLASKSLDGTVRIWDTELTQTLVLLPEPTSGHIRAGLAFHPTRPLLATLTNKDTGLRLWNVGEAQSLSPPIPTPQPVMPAIPCILWVDDKPQNNEEERLQLEQYGVTITLTLSTQEALDAVSREPFSLIISDMGRPEGRQAGLELLTLLRARRDTTPFILYSARTAMIREEAKKQGALGCTNNPKELLELVKQGFQAEKSGFYSEAGIRYCVGALLPANSDERVRDNLLLFRTSRQHTWLVFTNRRLFCLLDSQQTRKVNHLLQWDMPLEQAASISVGDLPGRKETGRVHIGARKNWLYSKQLHPDASALTATLRTLATQELQNTVADLPQWLRGVWQGGWKWRGNPRQATLTIGEDPLATLNISYTKNGVPTVLEQTVRISVSGNLIVLEGVSTKFIQQGNATGWRLDVFSLEADPTYSILSGTKRDNRMVEEDVYFARQNPASAREAEEAASTSVRHIQVAGTGSFHLSPEVRQVSAQVGAMLAQSGYGLITGGWQGVRLPDRRGVYRRMDPSVWKRAYLPNACSGTQ